MLNRKKLLIIILSLMTLFVSSTAFSRVTMKGAIYNGVTKKYVDLATVILLEAKKKVYTDEDGSYSITVPEPGEYTLIINSAGLKQLRTKINLNRNVNRNFSLNPLRIRGETVVITGKRDLQKISRHTMTLKELKSVPATFGDSINALTSLPGVIRMGNDLFGPMVIRGGNFMGVNYYIDDIPIYNPIHYGGLHSVINSNLMKEIDLYSSAFPAQFGYASSAIININTKDSVKEFGGYFDIAAISASGLMETPILRRKDGSVFIAGPAYKHDEENESAGYIIASGRRGYIDLIALPLIELMTGDNINLVPIYWDYQFKVKYYINSNHSITAFLFGSNDYFKFVGEDDDTIGNDPLLKNFELKSNKSAHNQGLYYTYYPSKRFYNKIIAMSAFMESDQYLNLDHPSVASALRDVNIISKPYIYGLKERIFWEVWEDHLEVLGGIDFNVFDFRMSGKTVSLKYNPGYIDIADDNQFQTIILDDHVTNYVVGSFLETKFTFGWFSLTPMIRTDWLERSREVTIDPRGIAAIEFPFDLTISAAMGQYSYFHQTNSVLFDNFPSVATAGDEMPAEYAIHRVLGLEQVFLSDYRIKMEGFYNHFYNIAQQYYHTNQNGDEQEGLASGRIRAFGFELMLKKDLQENIDGLFGWISYTYTRSKFKSRLPTVDGLYGYPSFITGDPYGNRWATYEYEQLHNIKLILGYILGRHTFSFKYQVYSGFPYTPIVNSIGPDANGRYIPIYGDPHAETFEMSHRLDIRWTYRKVYSWGYVSFYIEIINIYNHRAADKQEWDYTKPYSPADNPTMETNEDSLGMIPNFGVEIKF